MSQNYYQEVSNYFGINTVKELIRNRFEKLRSATVRRTTIYAVWYLLNVDLLWLYCIYFSFFCFFSCYRFWRWNKVVYICYSSTASWITRCCSLVHVSISHSFSSFKSLVGDLHIVFLHQTSDLVINWVQVWTVGRPQFWTDESGRLSSKHSFTCMVRIVDNVKCCLLPRRQRLGWFSASTLFWINREYASN